MDAALLNAVANDPAVRPFLGGSGPLDMTAILSNTQNFGLVTDLGGFVVIKVGPRTYECHSLFPVEARGEHTAEAMRDGLHYLFVNTDCIEVVTKVPEGNGAALGGCRANGFVKSFTLDKGWPLPEGGFGPVDIYALSLSKWASKSADCAIKGKWFHDRLEELTDGKIPAHYDEPSHNQFVGAAVLMFEANNSFKATDTYNHWAGAAGFSPLNMLSHVPVVLETDGVILGISGGDMEVLKCLQV